MDEQIIPKRGDYVAIHHYTMEGTKFSTVVRCLWRDNRYRHFGVVLESGGDSNVSREPMLDTNKHHGWKIDYWWVAEANQIPVGVN